MSMQSISFIACSVRCVFPGLFFPKLQAIRHFLNPSTAQTITVGDKVPFTASIEPAGALEKVKWSAGSAVKLYSDANCTTEVGSAATDKLTVYAKGISAGTATVTKAPTAKSLSYTGSEQELITAGEATGAGT